MEYSQLEKMINQREAAIEHSFPALMKKVYLWMTFALIITGMTSWLVASRLALISAIFSNSILFWGLIIAEFGLVIWLSAGINKMSLSTATLLFILYSVINGVTLASIFIIYTTESIATTFFITAGKFGAMSVIGYKTSKDLSGIGRYLMMALIGLIIATVVNIFMSSSLLATIISYAGVLIFVGLTAYDTQKIKEMFAYADENNPSIQKYAVLGSLTLYLDFINLFLYLLRIFGRRD